MAARGKRRRTRLDLASSRRSLIKRHLRDSIGDNVPFQFHSTGRATIRSMHKRLKLCIVALKEAKYSETFIAAHVKDLPWEKKFLFGDAYAVAGGSDVIPTPLPLLLKALERSRWKTSGIRIAQALLARFLSKNDISMVLAEYGIRGVDVFPSCRRARVPLIVHFHGFDAYNHRVLARYERSYRELFEEASSIVVPSAAMADHLMSLGASPTNMHVNPYGVDTEVFNGADPRSAPPTFIAVGRFVDKKAPLLTLLAFSRVVQKHPDSRLAIVGDGKLMEAAMQLRSALRLEPSVDFPGVAQAEQVASLMRTARCFVQHSVSTSYGDSEGLPVAILEAMASGLPVVSTRHAGIPEAIVHDETGFLVDEKDVESMAGCMIRLIEDPDLAGELGRRGRQVALEKYSRTRSINALAQIIEDSQRSFNQSKR